MQTVLWICGGVLLLLLVLLWIVCAFIFQQLVGRTAPPVPKWILKQIAGDAPEDPYTEKAKRAAADFRKMPLEAVTLTAPDGAVLRGHVLVPEHPNGRLVLACHGAHSSGIGEFCFMAPYFYRNGYTLVMPDHRGCGESDGKYMGYGTHESRDTLLWLRYAEKRFPDRNIYLLGVSMGGATVLMMSRLVEDEAVKGVIADCAYTSAWAEFSYQLHTSFSLPDFPILHICNAYCRLLAGYSFHDASPIDAVRQAKRPVLFIHGGKDDFVPTFMQKQLYDACPTEKVMLTVENAVHARSYYTDPAAYEAALERFMADCEGATV